MAAAGRSRPGMINQGVARAFARVRKRGVLTFAAISEVGVGGRRVDGGRRDPSQTNSRSSRMFTFTEYAIPSRLLCALVLW